MIRVSDYIVSFLYKAGVHDMFVITGGGSMYLNDALACHNKMRYVCQHHEQSCAIAADAYARVREGIGAAMVTTGPAATNAITGVLSGWFDSIPFFVISGQVKRKEATYNSKIPGFRQMGVQELNIIPLVESITKYSITVNDPLKIRFILEEALYMATSGRPGPVWIDVPADVQNTMIDPMQLDGFHKPENPELLSLKELKQNCAFVLKRIQKARKPLIVAGNGIRCAHAQNEFLTLVNKLGIPFVTSNMAVDLLDYNHVSNIGMGGIKGQRAANIALQHADVLISIGNRLSVPFIGYEYEKFAPKAEKIVVDIDPTDHKKKTIHIDTFIQADAKAFITEMIRISKVIHMSFSSKWLRTCFELKQTYPVCLPQYSKEKGEMNMYVAVDEITSHLNNKDVIIADAGSAYYVVPQVCKIKMGQRLIIPGGAANMGYNLPASVGASIGLGKKRIICITGDGSFQSSIHELQTITHHKLPVKIFVMNNGGYLSIRNTQRVFFENRKMGESKQSGLTFPDLKKIAYAYDIQYFDIKNIKDMHTYLPKILQSKAPVICNVHCKIEQEIIPSVSSKKLPDGTMVSTSIDDMYPFLNQDEMDSIHKRLE